MQKLAEVARSMTYTTNEDRKRSTHVCDCGTSWVAVRRLSVRLAMADSTSL